MLGSNRVCPKDTKDLYYYTWLRLDDPQSKEFQQNRAYHIAEMIYQNHIRTLNKEDPDTHLCTYSDTATASIATKKIGEYEYLAIVLCRNAPARTPLVLIKLFSSPYSLSPRSFRKAPGPFCAQNKSRPAVRPGGKGRKRAKRLET